MGQKIYVVIDRKIHHLTWERQKFTLCGLKIDWKRASIYDAISKDFLLLECIDCKMEGVLSHRKSGT